jgi:hypothetical protein
MKKLLLTTAVMLAVVSTLGARPVLADEPRGSLGLGRMHGWNAGASQSGCGSSFAICRYRANLRRNGEYTYRRAHNGNWSPTYQKLQQRLAQKCNPGTVWMDACR